MPIAQTRLEILQICKLLQCIRQEDRNQVEKLTVHGVPHLINFNEPNDGDTALHIAAIANNDTMIEFLLELGAHPDVVDFKGRSAMMRAAEYGHVQCLHKLAKRGADMKICDLEGKGILFYCIVATQRHEDCVDIALAYGADVNNKSKDGVPVLLKACETAKENEDICLKLLSKGADPNGKHEKTNRTALMAAAQSGSAKVVRGILERGADINQVTLKTRRHAAHEAAKGGFFDVLVVLGAFGAIFDQYDDQMNNPIHLAAEGGHANCIKYLSQRGCNPRPKNADGNTAKSIAKEQGHKDAGKEIRKAEKSFGRVGKNNEPWALLLYDFCYEKKDQLMDLFTKLDGDGTGTLQKDEFIIALQNNDAPLPDDPDLKKIIQAHDKNRDGSVDYTDFLGGKKYINKQYLMSAFEGKKKKKKGGKGKKSKGKTKIIMPICTQPDGPRNLDGGPPEMFVAQHILYTDSERFDRDHPPKHPLQDDSGWYLSRPEPHYININEAVKHSDMHTLGDALAHGMNVDVTDKYYKTPLMIAAAYGNLMVVKFLIEHGANVNAQDNFKWTPLHFACHAGLLDVVDYLLDKGSNIEATTVNGATPLIRAIESSRPEVVQCLLDHGAKLQVENKKGHTPVDIAAAYGDLRVYELIKTRWDAMPNAGDKKKGKAPPSAKRPSSSPADADASKPVVGIFMDSPHDGRHRKGSILRAASALAGDLDDREDITYVPIKTWSKQPTTEELLSSREERRQRYGWQIDFADFKMPFQMNIAKKIEAEGGEDDGDD